MFPQLFFKHFFKHCLFVLIFWLNLLSGCNASELSSTFPSGTPTNAQIVHLLDRLSFGTRPGDIAYVRQIGVDSYLQEQLHPETLPEPASLTQQLSQLKTLTLPPGELVRQTNETLQALRRSPRPNSQTDSRTDLELRRASNVQTNLALQEATQARLWRAIASPRQLQEVMVDFWFNHFNLGTDARTPRILVGAYERQAIRPHVMGKFRDLLGATAHHAAMQSYLDNWLNTDPSSPGARGIYKGLNENYARELMELHTLGVDGGYTQKDVVSLAQILTGWGICTAREAATPTMFCFHPQRHDGRNKVLLGQAIPGGGIDEGERSLDLLAHSPATAHHISYKLAQYFVADQPSPALVDRLAQRFLETDGELRLVLETLFRSSEFWDQQTFGKKFKTPYQYVLSTLRASAVEVKNLVPITQFLLRSGMVLYGCDTPQGYPQTQSAWLSSDAILRRLNWSTALVRGNFLVRQQRPNPVDIQQLTTVISKSLSTETTAAIASSPPGLKAALLLSSPEFMYR